MGRRAGWLFLCCGLFAGAGLAAEVLPADDTVGLALNAEEQAWLAAHPLIRVAADPDYAPFQFTDAAGQSVGVANDYLAIIGQRLGVRFDYVRPDSWAQALALVKSREADMVAVATQTPERQRYLRFTTPYVAFPDVIVTRVGEGVASLEALHGRHLASVKGFGINEFLRDNHPLITLRMAPDVKTLLARVSTGEVGAGVLNLATLSYAIQQWKITNLHVSSQTPFSYQLALAVRGDWPMLQRLLQKGVDAIGDGQRQLIFRKWVGLQPASWKPTRDQVIGFGVVLIIISFTATLIWNRQLRKQVASRTAELQRAEQDAKAARATAEQANRTKTDFLAAASHDLRQPLHAMSLQIGQLKESLEDEQAAAILAQISHSQRALSDILNALLDISHLDAGTLKPKRSHFPLAPIFTRLENDFTPQARERGVVLRFHATRAWVYSDATLLYRVLANLVDNAIKYTHDPGVLIGARRCGGRWCIAVWDCGPGIPEAQQQAIFDNFVQLDNPGRDRRKGLGLGLSIVQRLAQLLGHSLSLDSRRGRGSCFRLALPAGMPLPRQVGEPVSAEERGYSLQGAVVLVVDDDPDVLTASRDLLSAWQCAVLTAASLEEAVSVAADEDIDVIIADYRLADGHTGLEVVAALDERGGKTHRAMMITGNVNPGELDRLRGGSYPVLSKPVSPVSLRGALHRLMVD